MKIIALVVTYNRKELLIECIAALRAQTRIPDEIVVVDNASTDGTSALFSSGGELAGDDIAYKRMNINSGGAGGFYKGMEYCRDRGDRIWLMDDDCIPEPTCLECLLLADKKLAEERVSFLASQVKGPDGEAMNLPTVDMTPSSNGYPAWYLHLGESFVKIRTATFVSVLLNCDAVHQVGLPLPWYFLWGDDTEYTLRLTRDYGPAYFVGCSVAVHKRVNARQLSVWTEDNPNRIDMYFYFVRNQLFNIREYQGKSAARKSAVVYLLSCVKRLVQPRLLWKRKRVAAVVRGVMAYAFKRFDAGLGGKLCFVEGGFDAGC
jgi:GT2 family glycosyltransferase